MTQNFQVLLLSVKSTGESNSFLITKINISSYLKTSSLKYEILFIEQKY